MATLHYDGRAYPIADDDVPAVVDAIKALMHDRPGFIELGTAGGGLAQLFISPGVAVAVHSGEASDADVDTTEPVLRHEA